MIPLSEELVFPDPHLANDEGWLAYGGDLSPERLLLAYSQGIFPWFGFRMHEEIQWYCPMERFVIFPNEIHISHSMRTLINKGTYSITVNQAFDDVIEYCAALRFHEWGAWLGPQMIKAYKLMHQLGHATSVEVWNSKSQLAGGLYGITLKRCFFGESMFSLEPNTSKLALIALAYTMQKNGGKLIDCQFETPHLRSMGGRYIPYDEYMAILNA
ncbi:MAG: leucyl/phenylalanyl-tRNA--protein transferase [Muribaculaceae bacterium]|nr:leucyl/phenylalanyl-tRNA--protein transferase [Muribaculaceae bacterium]